MREPGKVKLSNNYCECGSTAKKTVEINAIGDKVCYKDLTDVEIKEDFYVGGCPDCGAWGLWASQCKILDEILEPEYQRRKGGHRKCPNCNDGTLEFIEGTPPYDSDHYMCNECCSTFTTSIVEDM